VGTRAERDPTVQQECWNWTV